MPQRLHRQFVCREDGPVHWERPCHRYPEPDSPCHPCCRTMSNPTCAMLCLHLRLLWGRDYILVLTRLRGYMIAQESATASQPAVINAVVSQSPRTWAIMAPWWKPEVFWGEPNGPGPHHLFRGAAPNEWFVGILSVEVAGGVVFTVSFHLQFHFMLLFRENLS